MKSGRQLWRRAQSRTAGTVVSRVCSCVIVSQCMAENCLCSCGGDSHNG